MNAIKTPEQTWSDYRAKYPARVFEYDETLAKLPKPMAGDSPTSGRTSEEVARLYPELSLPLRPSVRIPLPEGCDAKSGILCPGNLAAWFKAGTSKSGLCAALRALPGIESVNVEEEVDRAWQRFISDARLRIASPRRPCHQGLRQQRLQDGRC